VICDIIVSSAEPVYIMSMRLQRNLVSINIPKAAYVCVQVVHCCLANHFFKTDDTTMTTACPDYDLCVHGGTENNVVGVGCFKYNKYNIDYLIKE